MNNSTKKKVDKKELLKSKYLKKKAVCSNKMIKK